MHFGDEQYVVNPTNRNQLAVNRYQNGRSDMNWFVARSEPIFAQTRKKDTMTENSELDARRRQLHASTVEVLFSIAAFLLFHSVLKLSAFDPQIGSVHLCPIMHRCRGVYPYLLMATNAPWSILGENQLKV